MLTVADVMTPSPATITPEQTLHAAIQLMKFHACRQLPVLSDKRLVGIITDRDIRLAMHSPFVLHDRSDDQALLTNTIVEDCMTPDPLFIESSAPARVAADLLRTYKFGSLPVIREGRLTGIVTVSDILRSYAELVGTAEGRLQR
jgi:acetoin utilization protein AcuB